MTLFYSALYELVDARKLTGLTAWNGRAGPNGDALRGNVMHIFPLVKRLEFEIPLGLSGLFKY